MGEAQQPPGEEQPVCGEEQPVCREAGWPGGAGSSVQASFTFVGFSCKPKPREVMAAGTRSSVLPEQGDHSI